MKNYLLSFAVLLTFSMAHAIEFQCPSKVDVAGVALSPPAGWIAYKGLNPPYKQKGETLGAFRKIIVSDGSPSQGLGDLIPDNEDSGQKQGFWVWTVKQLPSVYVGCEYAGSDIQLIKKIEGTNITSCTVRVLGNKNNILSCR